MRNLEFLFEIVDTILQSTTRFICNHATWADDWKRVKIEHLVLMLEGVLNAEGRVGLMMNVRRCDLTRITELLPSLQNPTVSQLAEEDWVAINTILEEKIVRDLLPKLKASGAQGLVEYPLNKIIE